MELPDRFGSSLPENALYAYHPLYHRRASAQDMAHQQQSAPGTPAGPPAAGADEYLAVAAAGAGMAVPPSPRAPAAGGGGLGDLTGTLVPEDEEAEEDEPIPGEEAPLHIHFLCMHSSTGTIHPWHPLDIHSLIHWGVIGDVPSMA